MGGQRSYLQIYDSLYFRGEEDFEESEAHFGSLGSSLPADINEILLRYTQGYKIAFE